MNKESSSNSDYNPVLTGRDLPQTKDPLVRLAEFISRPWVSRPAAAFTTASLLAVPAYAEVRAAEASGIDCEFQDGFKLIYDQIPGIVGACTEDEHHDSQTGDALQATTEGLLAWRKADNWTAFTDGTTTWINGPAGIQARPNDERFSWEGGVDQQAELQTQVESPPLLFNYPISIGEQENFFGAYLYTQVGVTTEQDLVNSGYFFAQSDISGDRARWDYASPEGYNNYAVTKDGKVIFIKTHTGIVGEDRAPRISSYEDLYGPPESIVHPSMPGDQAGVKYIYASKGFTLEVMVGLVTRIDVYTPTDVAGYLANDLVNLGATEVASGS